METATGRCIAEKILPILRYLNSGLKRFTLEKNSLKSVETIPKLSQTASLTIIDILFVLILYDVVIF